MRTDGFLRTPIRGDHQSQIANVAVSDVALVRDPAVADVFPQTLELAFDVNASVTEVQIAPVWPGSLKFFPDDPVKNVIQPGDVMQANMNTWSLTGDLVLSNEGAGLGLDLKSAFGTHVPIVTAPPDQVRYSKVRLTSDFLFTTIPQLKALRFVFEGNVVKPDDPRYLQKLIVKFLQGRASLVLQDGGADAIKDDALRPMPSVALDAGGGRTTLRVAMSTHVFEGLDADWFKAKGAPDALSGAILVDPAIDTLTDQVYNPAHPSHSIVPAWLVFNAAAAAAYAPDHGAATPVRAALAAARPDMRTWRRIDVQRPPIPGAPVSAAPQRTFPQHQLCWRATGGAGASESMRLPLSGTLYLPLPDAGFTWFAIPRNMDPAIHPPDDSFQLGLGKGAKQYLAFPQNTVDLDVTGLRSATLYAYLRTFDSLWVWDRFADVAPGRGPIKARAEAKWNAGVLDWFIMPPDSATRNLQNPIYGFIRESAGRHGLAPEFLQVVFFGEGGGVKLDQTAAGFNPALVLDCFGFVGLDLIVYRTARLPVGKPAVPPQVAGTAAEAEFRYNLVTNGYVDPATAALVNWTAEILRDEAGGPVTLQVGTVTGWAAAIELVAAELHARLDEMTAFCQALAPPHGPIPITSELQRRFLAYLRFNAKLASAQNPATNMPNTLKRFPPPRPADNLNFLFNTIQRIAVTEWQEEAGVYR
jgi:hypothetical protein